MVDGPCVSFPEGPVRFQHVVGSHTHCWVSTAGPLMTADPIPESCGGVQGAGPGAAGLEHLPLQAAPFAPLLVCRPLGW